MSETHFEVLKSDVKRVIAYLIVVLVALVSWGAKDHINTNKEDKIDLMSSIKINQVSVEAATRELLKLDAKVDVHEAKPYVHHDQNK